MNCWHEVCSCVKCSCLNFNLVFQKVPIGQWLKVNQLQEFKCNFRHLKWFSSILLQKLQSDFLLKLRFLKMRLFVIWLKCLFVSAGLRQHNHSSPGIPWFSKVPVWIGKTLLGALQMDLLLYSAFASTRFRMVFLRKRFVRCRWKRFRILINWWL